MTFPLLRALPVVLVAASVGCGSESQKPPPDDGEDPGVAMGNANRPPGVAQCYTSFSSSHPASLNFWVTFRDANLEGRAQATAGLADAATSYPDEEEFALLNGLSNLWRVAEPTDAEVNDTASFVQAALTAKSELQRAFTLCPTDYRIPAWLGPVLVRMGRATNDQASVDSGLTVLQQGIDHYPSFVLFSKLLVYADYPRDDPNFQNALDAVTANIGACSASDPACSNHKHAAHNIEGASIFLGDVYVKAGDRQSALNAFGIAHTSTTFADWKYQSLLKTRLDTLDARLAAFATTDTADDPESAWQSTYQCSVCHQR